MTGALPEQILKVVQSVWSDNVKDAYPLHSPTFQGNEWQYVKECIDTTWVSSTGKYVDRFEKELAEFTGVKRAVAVVNGTAALHIALKLSGVEKGDEVLVPALTFVASANAISYCGANPHFVDSDHKTLGINPEKLFNYLLDIAVIKDGHCYNKITNRRIKAIVPMHTFGHPVDMDQVLEIAYRFNIEIVEDAAEGLGSYYKGNHVGSYGKINALSFNGNKIITTGGGGAILTNDENLADMAKHITTTAKLPHDWDYVHDQVGYNYRMPNINAALGCAQLEQLPKFLENKRNLALQYKKYFSQVKGVQFFEEPGYAESNYWLNSIVLSEATLKKREEILKILNDNKIFARPVWRLMNNLEMYKHMPSMDLSCSKKLEKSLINLPSSAI